MSSPIVWSDYQTRIFDWALSGARHGIVEATAGAGKTTVIVETCKRLVEAKAAQRILYVTFSRRLAEEAGAKLGPVRGVDVSTLHALGHRMIKERWPVYRERDVSRYKTSRILSDLLQQRWGAHWERPRRGRPRLHSSAAIQLASDPLAQWVLAHGKSGPRLLETTLTQAIEAARVAALSPAATPDYVETLERECWRRSIELPAREIATELLTLARAAHVEGLNLVDPKAKGRGAGSIDFTDMLTAPPHHQLTCSTPYDWVVLDEAQDLSPASAAMIELLVPPDGSGARLLAVGDRDQAIMAFAGADSRSMDSIAKRWDCEQMSLPVTYRCPAAHVELARQLAPKIEARPDAPEGSIEEATVEALKAGVEPGDLVLCRFNAPLMGICLSLIREGAQARLFGRDIAQTLTTHAESASDRYPGEDLDEALRLMAQAKIDSLRADEPDIDDEDLRIAIINDTRDALLVLLREMGEGATLTALSARLKELFANEGAAVWCSSVHRSKGLEADTVWIACPDALPFTRRAQSGEDKEAERCVAFVAVTRAKRDIKLLSDTGAPSWLFAEALAVKQEAEEARELAEVLDQEVGVVDTGESAESAIAARTEADGDEIHDEALDVAGVIEEVDVKLAHASPPEPSAGLGNIFQQLLNEEEAPALSPDPEPRTLTLRQRRQLEALPWWPRATLPERLKIARLRAGLSQAAVAEVADITRRTVAEMERTDCEAWRSTALGNIERVCRAIGLTLGELFAGL